MFAKDVFTLPAVVAGKQGQDRTSEKKTKATFGFVGSVSKTNQLVKRSGPLAANAKKYGPRTSDRKGQDIDPGHVPNAGGFYDLVSIA